ncbi:KH domain RNA binding protein YlqC [Euzebya pacifica]|uniref:RNA-binding protein KhpA n=3 Tax=Euzebya TaxID=908623 RepID=A0A346Y0V5_9ACTN|nr:KH domain RNA binding protein YlqC [Euzebya pacifica]
MGMDMTSDVLDFIAKNLVDHPDDVDITTTEEEDGTIVLELRVHPDDMGKVIGKRGRTAKAIRTMVKAAATREGVNASVEIIE